MPKDLVVRLPHGQRIHRCYQAARLSSGPKRVRLSHQDLVGRDGQKHHGTRRDKAAPPFGAAVKDTNRRITDQKDRLGGAGNRPRPR